MRIFGLGVVGASWLIACGATELGRAGAHDRGSPRASPRAGPVSHSGGTVADAGSEPGPGPTSEASAPPGPVFCSGAGWSDPSAFVLIGATDASIVLVRADGRRHVVAPLKGSSGTVSWVSENGQFAVTENLAFGKLRGLRLNAAGEVLLDVEVDDLLRTFSAAGAFHIEADGTMVLRGRNKSEIRVLPDGTIERNEYPEPTVPPTPEGYRVLGDADKAGWKVVAIPSNVVPWDNAFYDTSTATLQPVRYRSDWAPNTTSKGRIVYLGTTTAGVALVDEGVDDAHATPLQGTMKFAQVYGSDARVVVKQGDVPVAWLDTTTRAVKVFDPIIALTESGATHTGSHVQLLIKDSVPRLIIDSDSMETLDVSAFPLGSGGVFSVYAGTGTALVTVAGVPALLFDRKAATAKLLDPAVVIGSPPPTGTAEIFTSGKALAVVGGVPRSLFDLDTGEVTPLNLGVAPAENARTHPAGDRAVMTVDGLPRKVVDIRAGTVSDVAPLAGPVTYDSVTTAGDWLVALNGLSPVFRVNAATAEAVFFAAAPLPQPYGFYDARFASDPANYPPTTFSVAGASFKVPAVTSDGNVLALFRDDVSAGAHLLAPGDAAWRALGRPVHDVIWTTVSERERTWIVSSGQEYSCYCTWSKVSWTAPSAGADLLTDAVQIVPRGAAPPVAAAGGTNLDFHPSESCVLALPGYSPGSENLDEPFAYDLENGTKTSLRGLKGLRFIDAK